MRATLRAWVAVWRSAVLHRAAYLGEEILGGAFLVAILLVFHQLYSKVLPGGMVSQGYDANRVLWYVAMTEAILTAAPRLSGLVDAQVRSGHVATFLLRPISYVSYHRFRYLGEFTVTFPLRLLTVSLVSWLLAGPPPGGFFAFFALVVPVAMGTLLNFQINMTLALSAFWIEDPTPLFWVYQKTLFLFGGLLIPLAFYPDWVRQIAENTPLAYILSAPAQLALAPNWEGLLSCLTGQVLWFVILASLTEGLYRLGTRRLVIAGG